MGCLQSCARLLSPKPCCSACTAPAPPSTFFNRAPLITDPLSQGSYAHDLTNAQLNELEQLLKGDGIAARTRTRRTE